MTTCFQAHRWGLLPDPYIISGAETLGEYFLRVHLIPFIGTPSSWPNCVHRPHLLISGWRFWNINTTVNPASIIYHCINLGDFINLSISGLVFFFLWNLTRASWVLAFAIFKSLGTYKVIGTKAYPLFHSPEWGFPVSTTYSYTRQIRSWRKVRRGSLELHDTLRTTRKRPDLQHLHCITVTVGICMGMKGRAQEKEWEMGMWGRAQGSHQSRAMESSCDGFLPSPNKASERCAPKAS